MNMKTVSAIMAALRASYTIESEVLLKFNEMVPPGERSQLIQRLSSTFRTSEAARRHRDGV
jgi:hypothetical protein